MRLKDLTILSPQYSGVPIIGDVSFVPMESIRTGYINPQLIDFNIGQSQYTYFANGDLLIAKVTPCFENGNIAIAENLREGIGYGSSELFVVRCGPKILTKYLFYLCFSLTFKNSACSTMCGVAGLKRISPLFMKTFEFPLPDLVQQHAIISYLDGQTIIIDTQISILEKKKVAYELLKRSIINAAVTKGINPNVRFQESNIEWLGMIPEHWGVVEMKYYCKSIFAGATPSTKIDSYWDGNIPWIPSGACHDTLIEIYDKTITEEGLANSSTKMIPAHTTLLAMTGATCANTGYLMFDSCANQSVCAFVEKKKIANSRYLFYMLQAARDYIISFKKGGVQGGITVQDCSLFKVPRLLISEQNKIVDYLDSKLSKINVAISIISNQIEQYKLLKRSLINEVISGQRPID